MHGYHHSQPEYHWSLPGPSPLTTRTTTSLSWAFHIQPGLSAALGHFMVTEQAVVCALRVFFYFLSVLLVLTGLHKN